MGILVGEAGLVDPVHNQRALEDDSTYRWQHRFADFEATVFPSLPSTVAEPLTDTTREHWISPIAGDRSNVATSALLQLAWAVVSRSHSGSNDQMFGTITISDTASNDTELGSVLCTVPVRMRIVGTDAVEDLLVAMQQQFGRVSHNTEPADHFGTHLIMHHRHDNLENCLDFGLESRTYQCQDLGTCALVLHFVPGSDEVRVIANFDSRVIEAWLVESMLRQLNSVVQQIGASVGTNNTVDDIDMLTSEDREQIWEWNRLVPSGVEECVHDLIARQAKAHPDAQAVCAWDGDLSYSELDTLSSRLAAQLVQLGVGRDIIVPLCFKKSMWTPVAMLAVLKAGGAFCLLDTSQPMARLATIIKVSKASLVVSSVENEDLSHRLSDQVYLLGPSLRDQKDGDDGDKKKLPATQSSAAAYVVFTSGSTGTPKGVVIQHNSLCCAMKHQLAALNLGPNSRVFDFASYSFDVAVHNVIATLIAGGCICTPSNSSRRDNLAGAMRQLQANWANLTTTVLKLLDVKASAFLQTLVLLGEAVRVDDISPWWNKTNIINTYGPAECTPISTINQDSTSLSSASRIGKGLGVVTWVVDPNDHNVLLSPGIPGELLIEGHVLARGYLGDAEKTAAAFIEDPTWLLQGSRTTPGRQGRLYKTGDLVVYNEDGSLTFVGRKDTQIKIRGQRVELGEIEHHIHKSLPEPDLMQAVAEVIVPNGASGNPIIAAFLLLTDHSRLETLPTSQPGISIIRQTAQLEDRLFEVLPRYMAPSIYLALPQFSTTPSGKLDRRRLREIGGSFSQQELSELQTSGSVSKKDSPQTEAEEQMQQIWANVLQLDLKSIGRNDSFFRLGGDSLAAMQLVGEARKYGKSISVAEVFRFPALLDLTNVAKDCVENGEEEIPPFSLIDSSIDMAHLRSQVAAECQIDPTTIADVYPCSPLQEGLMSMSTKRPGHYIGQSVLKLSSSVDVDAFRSAWLKVISATAVLRTRIVQHTRLGLLQVVLSELPEWHVAEDLDSYLRRDKSVPMGLGDALVRCALVLNPHGGGTWFVLSIHHALYDGWSLPGVIEAAESVYQGDEQSGSQASFNNFIRFLGQQDKEQDTAYWQRALQGCEASPFPVLPSSIQEPIPDSVVECQWLPLGLKDSDSTASTLLRAAWSIVASHYTNSEEVVFGTTVTGRNAPVAGIETMLGPTIATVPIRVQMTSGADQTIGSFLNAMQTQATEMIPYEQTGLQRISKLGPDAEQACHFQTLLVVQPRDNDFGDSTVFGDWTEHSDVGDFNTYSLMLQCFLGAKDQGIKIVASFDSRVIEAWLVQRMLKHFEFVAQQLAAKNPTTDIHNIEILTKEDINQLGEWNGDLPLVTEQHIHDLMEARAQEQPYSPAICAWDGNLSYGDFEAISTRLAAHLFSLGIVGPEVIVPLCFEKSMWTPVALLAVLKAGGAFLLLDPSSPRARLETLCRKSSARLVLTSRSCVSLVQDFVPHTFAVDDEAISQLPPATTVRSSVVPSNTAYVVFTSGSTGQPKGCRIEHHSAVSALRNHGKVLNMQADTRTLQFGSYNFAGSLVEMLLTLTHGGCICIPSEEQRRGDIAAVISGMRVNWAFLTATVLDTISQGPTSVPTLKTLCVGGEPIRKLQIQLWASYLQLRQTYGSSETSGVISSARLTASSDVGEVGKTTCGRCWIVNSADVNELVLPGAIGEIIVEGQSIGRDYIDAPETTAKTFIKPPTWTSLFAPSSPQARFYKTGDLGRYRSDGSIYLLGRKDTQVKLRGQRIELGEIEHQALLASADVRDVAVELIKPRFGDDEERPMLACFFTLRKGLLTTEQDHANDELLAEQNRGVISLLQQALEQQLPRYMVPAVFIPLQELPTTFSRKTDRKRLREIGSILTEKKIVDLNTARKEASDAPQTKEEERMQQLWARVLRIDIKSIGRADSFFRLGGDSISAMKLSSEGRRSGVALKVADVFQNPTLFELAKLAVDIVSETHDRHIPAFSLLEAPVDIEKLRLEVATDCGVDPGVVQDVYPCSSLQEGLLTLSSKRAGDYMNQVVLELPVHVDASALKSAWEKVVSSTTMLRTRIVQHSQFGFVQVVLDEALEWEEATDFDSYLTDGKNIPMGLGDRLSRLALVRDLHSTRAWVIWSVHHSLYDGWSLPRVLSAVHKAYEGAECGEQHEQVNFNAFIHYLCQQDTAAVAGFWNSALANYDGSSWPLLPSTVQEPFADTIRQHTCLPFAKRDSASDITTSTLVRAAWAVIAGRYSGSEDIVFGATVGGRNAPVPGIDNILGPTIATVPVRVRLEPSDTVETYLSMIQQEATDTIPYEQAGLQQIANLGSNAKHACSFQSLLVIQPEDIGYDGPLGTWKEYSEIRDFTTYALVLECTLHQEGIEITASFDSRVIEPWLVERMLNQFDSVARKLAGAEKDTRVADIDILVDNDRDLLWTWNGQVPPAIESCVHDLIARQTRATPNASAVRGWDGNLTYSQLEELASRLAHRLIELGLCANPETIVPLCFEKSTWMIVAMLAVLKAGGAFLPLDPSLPEDRRLFILQKTRAHVVISSPASSGLFSQSDIEVLILNHELYDSLPAIDAGAVTLAHPGLDAAAYLIFTSGSTGEPKGVVIEHQSIATSAWSHGSRMGLNGTSRVFQFASYTFDACILEIITTLVHGGCVLVPSDDQRMGQLALTMTQMEANFALLTPTVARMISPNDVPTLRTLVFGGEAMLQSDWESWRSLPNIFNAYGPTEAAICSVSFAFENGEAVEPGVIGTAVGCCTWVVDSNDSSKLVPPGVVGELVIEGHIVGRGYLDEPGKTAAAFVSDPPEWLSRGARNVPGRQGRLYKTGDLVRYTKNGNIIYVGRKDTQVKIRGQRLELSEVEHHVRESLPWACQAVAEVIKPLGWEGRLTLAVFIQSSDSGDDDTSLSTVSRLTDSAELVHTSDAVSSTLAQRLPTYMIPDLFFRISEIPLVASGKADRKLLRSIGSLVSSQHLDDLRSATQSVKHQPRTDAEKRLQSLWAKVLHVDIHDIGIHDNFFRLGGDSILAMQLVGEARRAGWVLTVADVFRQPRISDSALILESTSSIEDESVPPFSLLGPSVNVADIQKEVAADCGVDAAAVEDVYQCSPLQEGLFSISCFQEGGYVSQNVLELREDLSIETFKNAWEQVVASTQMLRTRIVQHGRLGLLQAVVTETSIWEEADDLESYLVKDKKVRRGLGDRLTRFALVKNAHQGQSSQTHGWFVWSIHHALYDGWSFPRIKAALQKAYQGLGLEQQAGFNNFIKYIRQQNEQDGVVFWGSYLADCEASLFPSLPSTIEKPSAGAVITHRIPRITVKKSGLTTSSLIRVVWAIVVSRYTNSDDVIFGATVAGRSAPVSGIESILGPTIATVPIRVQVAGSQTVSAVLEASHRQATEMMPYEQTGLQRIAKISPDSSHACGFQTLIVVHPQVDQDGSDGGSGTILGRWQGRSDVQDFSTYALTLQFTPEQETLNIVTSFDSRVIQPWLVRKMLKEFDFVAQQVASTGPETTVDDINILTAEDRDQIWEWNRQVPPTVQAQCVHDLFIQQARARPGAPAIHAWDGDLTYSELDELSTALACRLVDLGAKPEMVVPLCFEKSMWTSVALLATLKAGSAFLLLDPSAPRSRLELLCRKVGATMALASPSFARLLDDSFLRITVVDQPSISQLVSVARETLPPIALPSNTAYVIFTSGSTGEPKGCKIEHLSSSLALVNHGRQVQMTEGTRTLQFGSYTFAGSIAETLLSFSHGACLCVPSDDERRGDLSIPISKMNINWAFLTSTVVESLSRKSVASLKTLCVGGEPIRPAQISELADIVHLRQTYGSSETAGFVSSTRLTKASGIGDIGKPTAGRIWIVDAARPDKIAPIGAVGEILIEGPTVGREYINEPQKTAETFIPAPSWKGDFKERDSNNGFRFYRTGDLGRYRADGSIELLGRGDTQVKLRGQRIELGEVEHHCQLASADIQELAVELIKPRINGGGKGMLACFFTFRVQGQQHVAESGSESVSHVTALAASVPARRIIQLMQEKLEEQLPEYMIPGVFIAMPQLPTTMSRKIDRKRLRELGAGMSQHDLAELQDASRSNRRPPETEAERRIQLLWAQVLGRNPSSIGRDDSFFRLGGNSITAVQLTGEAHKANIKMTVANIFRHPKLLDMAATTAIVAADKDESVPAFSLLGQGDSVDIDQVCREVAVDCNVDPATIQDLYPCSPLQKGLLSLSSKHIGGYTSQSVLELRPDIDLAALRLAWENVVSQTAILRTRVVQHSRFGLIQAVVSEGPLWADLEAKDLDSYLREDKTTEMELGQPLSRFVLLQGHSAKRWLVWTIHHAVYDGWSLTRIIRDVQIAYEAVMREGLAEQALPNARVGFNAFIKHLGQQDEAAMATFWRDYLQGCEATPFPELPPTIHEAVADATEEHLLPAVTIRGSGMTDATLMRAGWAIVASRYSGCSDDVIFGSIITGRNTPIAGIETVLGPTIGTVPVRVRITATEKIDRYLDSVQRQAADMIPHEQMGLHEIAKISPDTRHACNFQTLLVVQPGGEEVQLNDGLGTWHEHAEVADFNTYALLIQCILNSDGVKLVASFDSRTIEPWVVRKMLGQFEFVLQQLADAGPHKTIGDIELLTPQDTDQLWKWNQNLPPVIERCIVDLIADQTQARPSAQAICSWDGSLTYTEVDEFSTRLATRLVELGVTTGSIVPLCFEKSKWVVIAILAVLKAGGAFVLIDLGQIKARLGLVLEMTGATLLLTGAETELETPEFYSELAVFRVGQEIVTVGQGSSSTVQMPRDPHSVACFIFTSGSTGRPKAVTIENMTLTTSSTHHGAKFGFGPDSRVLQFASHSFDAAVMEFLTTLRHGGCICIPSESDRLDNLQRYVRTSEANLTFLTPSVARTLVPRDVPSLKTIILGGEAMGIEDLTRWKGHATMINGYGPAECTICCAMNVVSFAEPINAACIGKPVGSVAWVVDSQDHSTLVPQGVTGELLVEGPILAREYLNDPQRTADAFIENPTWLLRGSNAVPGREGRLYKTGDLVRHDEQGNLVFMGRKDTQVKIRGQRVELGEIEHHIRQSLPEIQQAVAEVIVPADQANPVLAAFLLQNEQQPLEVTATNLQEVFIYQNSSGLEAQLAERLPRYMIPALYIVLSELPMTVSGKMDRRQLRTIGASFTQQQLAELRSSEKVKQTPETPAERLLQHLWAEVLCVAPNTIGLDDSFFRLGGDSISAMQLSSEARRSGMLIKVADIFQHPTLLDLARFGTNAAPSECEGIPPPAFSLLGGPIDIEELRADVASDCGIEPDLVQDIYPCSPLQEGLLSLSSRRKGEYINQSVWQLRSDIDVTAFKAAWNRIVELTPVLRTRIVQHDKFGLLQVVLTGAQPAWTRVDDLDSYLQDDKTATRQLGGPLSRFALLEDTDKISFIWSIHHALYDGWSFPRILTAVEKAYSQVALDEQVGFNSFIRYLTQQDQDEANTFWQASLANCEAPSFPPLGPTVKEPAADTVVTHLCSPCTIDSDVTTATLIRAAWAIIASRYSNSKDVVFGATVAGRNAPVANVHAILGPTIATVPVRILINEADTIRAYLETVQKQATEMIPYEQTGLLRIAGTGPDAQHACGFQTLLVVHPAGPRMEHSALFEAWEKQTSIEDFTTYALMLQCEIDVRGINVTASLDSRMIEPWLVRNILGQFDCVLQQLTLAAQSKEDTLVGEIGILTDQDEYQLWAWNRHLLPPAPQTVQDMISQQTRARPDAPAICAWDGNLTYGELDSLSTSLARHISQLGVEEGAMVPLCFDKSKWTPVAVLGVMKAGGAFVMLDTSQPFARLHSSVLTVQATMILASPSTRALAERLCKNCLIVDDNLHRLPASPPASLPPRDPSSALYAVFTSGSTGKPKGIAVSDSAFASGLHYQLAGLGFGPGERILDFASYVFDVAVHNVLAALASGGCLCIPSEDARKGDVAVLIDNMGVTLAELTPSVARTIHHARVPSLKTLILVGEAVEHQDIIPWQGRATVMNGYGPAECAMMSTINHSLDASSARISIGKGVGVTTWIVDPANHDVLLPPGQTGELLLETNSLARGYINDPDKTAKFFVENPSWLLRGSKASLGRESIPGRTGRLYKTGDLVRYNEDGTLIYLGRKDMQVKIRGQRVELGEVEHHVLQELPVQQAVAEVIIPGDQASPVLAVFLVQDERRPFEADEVATIREGVGILRDSSDFEARLMEMLPLYMVPGVFLVLSELPMTASGKTDRRRLQMIGASLSPEQLAELRSSGKVDKQEPKTAEERQMRQFWAEVLQLEADKIGREDSFFYLGGDSIKAMQLVAKARKAGARLTVANIFQNPRLSNLASMKADVSIPANHDVPPFSLLTPEEKQNILSQIPSVIPSIQPDDIVDILPLTEFQHEWISDSIREPSMSVHYLHLDLNDTFDLPRLKSSCNKILEQFPILRSVFVPILGNVRQVVLRQVPHLSFRDILAGGDMEEATADVCAKDATDMQADQCPTSFIVLRHETKGHRVIVRLSHAQYDGTCMSIIFRELINAYHGEPASPTTDFKVYLDYISRTRPQAIEFWKEYLNGSHMTRLTPKLAPSTTPSSRPRKVETEVCVPLPATAKGVTAATVARAAWAMLLSRFTGETDVVFGEVVAGRSAALQGIEGVVGPCLNTVPVRAHITAPPQPHELMVSLQDQYARIGQADALGLRDILSHCCTGWPGTTTAFDSVILHQNIDANPTIQIAGSSYVLDGFSNPFRVPSALTMVSSSEGGFLKVMLAANDHIVTKDNLEILARLLKEIVSGINDK